MQRSLQRVFQFKRLYLLLLTPLGLLLTFVASRHPRAVEKIYAQGLHLFLERTIGWFISLFPFSLTELLIVAAVLFALWYIVRTIRRNVKNKKTWKHIWYRFCVNVLCTASLAYFLFVMTMGLDYYRLPASEYLGLEVTEYSKEDLEEVCRYLALHAAETRAALEEDENGVSKLSDDNWWATSKEAARCFNAMAKDHPGIGTLTARNKPMIFSKMMSSVLTMGLYFPYTFESNINVDMTAYTVPSTMCHELSHVKGFMREEEANFLGFLSCMYSDRPDFRYSGYMMAFEYAIRQLAEQDEAAASGIVALVGDGVLRDDAADGAYWEKYRHTVISDTSEKVYDGYLRSNGQTDGMRSYGKMLDLVIEWYKQNVQN